MLKPVPQNWHAKFTTSVASHLVELSDGRFVVELIRHRIFSSKVTNSGWIRSGLIVMRSEHPPSMEILRIMRLGFLPGRGDYAHSNNILEPFQVTCNNRSVGPRTGIRYVEMVAVFSRRELGIRIGGDPVPEERGISNEGTFLVLLVSGCNEACSLGLFHIILFKRRIA